MRELINANRMQGLTLVELLVAATLSVLLLLGAIAVFIGSKESFNVGEDISRVQQNIRFTSARIFNDVSMAGYVGCAPFVSTGNSSVPDMLPDTLGDFSQAIIGGEAVGPNNSDSLTVHFAHVESAVPYDDSSGAYSDGKIGFRANSASDSLREDDILVMSDCSNAMIVKLLSTPTLASTELDHTGKNNVQSDDLFGNESPAYIYKMDGVTYQLDTSPPDSDGKYVSRLMATRLDDMANPQLILDGVEDFQVEYGIDANGDSVAERYADWDEVVAGNHQQRLVSARITIVVNSGKPQADTLGRVTDSTKSMVKSTTFTVALRNFMGS
ncbi:MAG: PilW family protein [Candidatus Polarisedimenticolaceae bacterium]|nr:PilW family protein [Candidatus Polarisedimenticolaceae bacterium]